MIIRLPLAFILGLVIYMIAMAMTVYDGLLSLIFQPIVGAILTAVALLAICVVGSPLLFGLVWKHWRRIWWGSVLIAIAGLCACIASWHPSLRIRVLNPDTQEMVDSFQPALALSGWFAAMFGIAFCPLIGFRGDRRWV